VRKVIVYFFIVSILFILGCGIANISMVEAPILTVEVLRQETEWTPSKIEMMIRFISKEYKFDCNELIWLAEQESSLYRNKKCGDNGKSCGLYQIKEITWNEFVQKYKLNYTDRFNPVDQTIATGLALKDGKQLLWSPYKKLLAH